MTDIFPVIEHIDEVLAAIDGREEFFVHRNQELGFVSVLYRYVMADTFPDPGEKGIDPHESRRRALVRECRGTTFDAHSGKVIARKFHKFFNIGERLETQPHLIDWARPHVRLVKADGSLMTPLVFGEKVRWSSKMGVTKVSAPVEAFVEDQHGYRRLAHDAAALGVTPLFEWCSSEAQRIILDYPETKLVLLAVRENVSGRYWSQDDVEAYGRSYGVPCIERVSGSVTDHVAYRTELAALTGVEGEVVAFATGERYKAKTAEYLRFHRALAGLVQEKDVLALVLSDGKDDVKPFLNGDLADKLDAFSGAVNLGLDRSAERLGSLFREGYREFAGDRKRFAVEFVSRHKGEAPFLFALWPKGEADDATVLASARDLIADYVQRNLGSSTRVAQVRHFFGDDVSWTAEIPDLDA
jgi:T4 RnlA family RNA ligase